MAIGSAVSYVSSLGVEQVEVPEVREQSQADATTTIESAGLTVGEVLERTNASVPAGLAVKTDPAAGSTVDKGSAVTLTMSVGPKQVDVPDIVGQSEADAVAALEGADLVAGSTTAEYSDTIPAGSVISSAPAAGTTVDAKSSVDFVLSLGIEQVAVPDLSGPAADADAKITDAGLVVGEVTEDFDESVAEGDVSSQSPSAGTTVDKGSSVDYVSSLGPTPSVKVPAVRDLPQAEAVAAIEGANLVIAETVERTHEKVADGDAIKTAPAADEEVLQGSEVTLYVSTGSKARIIPEVKDQPAAEAQAALEAEGLVVTSEERTNSKIPAGNAVKTEPAAGETVDVGSDVLLIVSKGPKQVVVPDVVGLSKADANAAITDGELTVGAEAVVENDAPKNTVLAQEPAPDGEVDKGSAVDITLSSGPPMSTIPEVKDQPAAEAQAALEAEGLVVTSEERTNSKIPAGNAVKTEPAAGETVAEGSDVLLIVSKGPKLVVVPNVVGMPRPDAKAALADVGLTIGEVQTAADTSPKSTVLSQEPAGDSEAPKGSAVDLIVSSGPPMSTIPEVKDQPAAEAQAALEAEGLVVTSEERTNSKIPAGNAVKTEPAAGETVDVGSDVLLIVSKGPKQVVVPNIVGRLKAEANEAIKASELSVGEQTSVENDAPKNTVLAQEPAADSQVDKGSAVDYTLSSGPPPVIIPEVKNESAADAEAALTRLGLKAKTQERTNAHVAAGDAVKTDPPAGESAAVGSEVVLTISVGPKQVTVPDIGGLSEADAKAALTDAEVKVGERSEANSDTVLAGNVVSQEPAAGTTVDKNSPVAYTISLGPVIEPMGFGGDLSDADVASQLDVVASEVEVVRGVELGATPYDGTGDRAQELALAERVDILRDPDAIGAEENALKRLGLLKSGDDLEKLLEQLYGQALPIWYVAEENHQSILSSIDSLDAGQQAQAAREFGRAATLQQNGPDAARTDDKSVGDEAMAAYALEQGDGTAVMNDWAATYGSKNKANEVIVPGDDGVYASMPLLLQREYSFPFLEGRNFVDQLRKNGGWDSVDDAWGRIPESTEQILHPKLYPNERPTTIVMDDIAGRLGSGWKEGWQQTMGELRIGVWLADGQPGEQSGPRAPVKLPKANAAAGWGGDRLVSLNGPDGQWAVVWQTKWDSPEDVDQFVKAANKVIADLPGAHAVVTDDVSSGVSNPVLVLLTGSADTLTTVSESLGVAVATPS